MTADIIQVKYNELETLVARFGQQAENNAALGQRMRQVMAHLDKTGWEGKGAAAFQAEMSGEVLPAFDRLTQALQQSQSVTRQMIALMRQAEEEAAQPFREKSLTPIPFQLPDPSRPPPPPTLVPLTDYITGFWEQGQKLIEPIGHIIDVTTRLPSVLSYLHGTFNTIPLANNAGAMIKNPGIQDLFIQSTKMLNNVKPLLEKVGNVLTILSIVDETLKGWNEADGDLFDKLGHASLGLSKGSVKGIFPIGLIDYGLNLTIPGDESPLDWGFNQTDKFLHTDAGYTTGTWLLNTMPIIAVPLNSYKYMIMRDAGMNSTEAFDFAFLGVSSGQGPITALFQTHIPTQSPTPGSAPTPTFTSTLTPTIQPGSSW